MKIKIIVVAVIVALVAFYFTKPGKQVYRRMGGLPNKVGTPVDSLHGVVVYYNGDVSHSGDRNLSADGYNLGIKYQCVEFVKRYYFDHYHHRMPDTNGNAKDFFNKNIGDGEINKARDLVQFTNNSKSKPRVGDLLIYAPTIYNQYGHVSIVSKVDEREIEIIQQNPGPFASSRDKLALINGGGKWKIDNDRIMGWLRMKSQRN